MKISPRPPVDAGHGVTHGCKLLEGPGVLLDTFTPRRDDFL